MIETGRRADLIALGAAQWRDPHSAVRVEAREALRDSPWSKPVVEAALDNVLWDLDDERAGVLVREPQPADPRPVLVVLPGNIIGPAIACAYCVAMAGSSAILKSPGVERALAPIVARQFDRLGPPLAGTIRSTYWKGGDAHVEATLLRSVRRVVAFGSDATIAQLRRHASGAEIIGYGESYSIGLILPDADVIDAASAAARDICIFDQRGCMSPQTIYVAGDDGRALLFARALASALGATSAALPRGPVTADEAAAIAMAIRRLAVSALAPLTHGLDTLFVGPDLHGAPEFVVAVEPSGSPTHEGFGRIVAVKACSNAERFANVFESERPNQVETLGYAGALDPGVRAQLLRQTFLRICPLGKMQRPPFGYRPKIEDFA